MKAILTIIKCTKARFCVIVLTFSAYGFMLPTAYANIIDDTHGVGAGSFELGNHNSAQYMSLGLSSTTITGWTVGGPGNGVDWLSTPAYGADMGSKSVDLANTSNSSISTVIPTVINNVYKISFGAATTDPGTVSAGSLVDQPFVADPSTSHSAQTFKHFEFLFTANGAMTTITFKATGAPTNRYGPVIDNVIVESVDPITCCPPWNEARLQSMWSEINTGQVNDPYVVKLTPTAQINQQMQAFADYAVTLNPNVQSMNLGFILYDCLDNSDQSTQIANCNPVWHGSPKLMSWGVGQGGVPTIYNFSGSGWTSNWPPNQVLDTATQASVPNNWYRLLAVPVIRYVDESFELLENCDLVVATFNRKQNFQKNRRVTSPMETIRNITIIDQSKVGRITGGNTIQESIKKIFKLKKKSPIKLEPRKKQKIETRQ